MNARHAPCSPRSRRAAKWKRRTRTLVVGKIPLLMGVINVTPDSFSDGGLFFQAAAAVERGLQLAAEGADLLDIGGQSTRPGSQPVDADEELRRVMPVVAALCEKTALPVSIDTSKATVAREALAAGAQVVNDVTALGGDAEMLPLAAETGCGVCAMHMRGTPQTMQHDPVYHDVVEDIMRYLADRRDVLRAAGIEQARIALDPGIGFGKTAEHNLRLLANAWRFHALGCPLLVGHSRKRFIGEVLGDSRTDRTAGTIGVAVSLASQGVQILRVHDVAPVRQALLLYEATSPSCQMRRRDQPPTDSP
jgi:dihydropteroate synthase